MLEWLGIEGAGIREIVKQAGNTRVIWTWACTSCKAAAARLTKTLYKGVAACEKPVVIR